MLLPSVLILLSLICAAFSIFDHMQRTGMPPNDATFNALIDAAAKVGDYQGASRVILQMQAAGHRPDAKTYTPVIHSLAEGSVETDPLNGFG